MSEEICRACGLCCDGSLFGRVRLDPVEIPMAKKRGLRIVGQAFEQPCPALHGGGCTIYEDRPRACRAFECVLYTRGAPLPEKQAIVTRTKALLARVDALSEAELAELRERMEQDFARV